MGRRTKLLAGRSGTVDACAEAAEGKPSAEGVSLSTANESCRSKYFNLTSIFPVDYIELNEKNTTNEDLMAKLSSALSATQLSIKGQLKPMN